MTIDSFLKESTVSLRRKGISSPELDAEVLLAAAVKKDRVFVLSHQEYQLSKKETARARDYLKKRLSWVPVAYILGEKEFYMLTFAVNRFVLIPRPETENLVESVLEWLEKHQKASHIADVGTGSGCIAVSIAKNAKNLKSIVASDTSTKALAIARKNSASNGLSKKILFKKTTLLKGIRTRFDCIVANLPYLSPLDYKDAVKNYPEIAYEPKMAHIGGGDGLRYIEMLLKDSKKYLKPHGALFLEIGAFQGKRIKELADTYLKGSRVSIQKDSSGFDRIACIELIFS